MHITAAALAEAVHAGERRALARAITLIESTRADHRERAAELLERLMPMTGRSIRIGISGVPGVGKSTFIEALGTHVIDRGHRVAVLAVDPSSALSGGSILGDKTRMEELARRPEAFIRPSPAGGTLGGVARRTREAMLACEAAGFDVIIVETVGVGQSETAVAEMTDLFLLLLLPAGGDELQGIKRGILELADVLAINKADGPGAERARRARAELERALEILRPAGGGRAPRVLTCSALTGDGLDEVWDAVAQHHDRLAASGELEARRSRQRVAWMWAMVDERLRQAVRDHPHVAAAAPRLEQAVRAGDRTAAEAAAAILEMFGAPG